MSKKYWAGPRTDKSWGVKAERSSLDIGRFTTQAEACDFARQLGRASNSEAFLQGRNGQIRERNTYGHDPRDIKG